MNKLYAAVILFISAFLLAKFLPGKTNNYSYKNTESVRTQMASENEEIAIFAGGCFWCMEHPFEDLSGVHQVLSGFTGGKKKNPTYRIPKKQVICRKNDFRTWNFDTKLRKMHWKLVFRVLNTENFRLRRANLGFIHFLESISTRLKNPTYGKS